MVEPEFPLRQEFLAHMLGVHPPAVSIAAGMLQKAGHITYKYGTLTILDPKGLIDGGCECYASMEREFEKIFHHDWREPAGARDALSSNTSARALSARRPQIVSNRTDRRCDNWKNRSCRPAANSNDDKR
jgi:hypothetical protein